MVPKDPQVITDATWIQTGAFRVHCFGHRLVLLLRERRCWDLVPSGVQSPAVSCAVCRQSCDCLGAISAAKFHFCILENSSATEF